MNETRVPDDIRLLMVTAMAVGASNSEVVQTTHTLWSPDGEVIVTRTEISFTFHHPCDHSPYRPPVGSTLKESTLALLRGEWPYSPDPSPPRTPDTSPSPPVYELDGEDVDEHVDQTFEFDKVTFTDARRDRRARKREIPAPERWYAVTRGLRVGAVQGAFMARTLTRGLDRAVVVHYPSQELAEMAFDLALRAGYVEVL